LFDEGPFAYGGDDAAFRRTDPNAIAAGLTPIDEFDGSLASIKWRNSTADTAPENYPARRGGVSAGTSTHMQKVDLP